MGETQSPVYLDYNATTPLAPEVKRAITESLDLWGNPSSGYGRGVVAREAIHKARCEVGAMVGATPQEIVFTSGGTEANHLAILSAIKNYRERRGGEVLPHVITSNIEHCAITLPLKEYEAAGLCRVTYVPVVQGAGRLATQEVMAAITESTCLLTIMLANNETGIIQPVMEIFREVRANPSYSHIVLHTDAAQAFGKIKVNAEELKADMITIVGHKFYGPRIGALFHRKSEKEQHVTPFLFGGGQEAGLRPGTENTPMIVGLGVAASLVTHNLERYILHQKTIRDYLRDELIKLFNLVSSDAPLKKGEVCWRYVDMYMLPNTLSVRVGGVNGVVLLEACSGRIEASTGAACHSGAGVSQTLLNSWRWSRSAAAETIRLSVGRDTTKADIDIAVAAIKSAVETHSGPAPVTAH